jgi:hypothetical protein
MNFENRLVQLERENAHFRDHVASLEQVVDSGISDRLGGVGGGDWRCPRRVGAD